MDHGLFTSANVPSSASADSEKTMYIGRDAPNENYGVHTGNWMVYYTPRLDSIAISSACIFTWNKMLKGKSKLKIVLLADTHHF